MRMRAFLILILLLQALVAQAGVPGIACKHAFPGTSEYTADSHVHSQNANTSAHTEEDSTQAHERCCCDFVGHCTSSAVDANQSLAVTQYYPRALKSRLIGESPNRGFDTPPYRPPSPTV